MNKRKITKNFKKKAYGKTNYRLCLDFDIKIFNNISIEDRRLLKRFII